MRAIKIQKEKKSRAQLGLLFGRDNRDNKTVKDSGELAVMNINIAEEGDKSP